MAVEYGPFVQLLAAAQADTDPVHRQAAMDQLAIIAPTAGATGADGHCPGDRAAAAILARLYPQPQPARDRIEHEALTAATQIIERHKTAALTAIRTGAGISAGQGQ